MHFLMLLVALVVDALLGEPDWAWSRVPHPIVLIGRAIGIAENRCNRGENRKAKGMLVTAGLVAAALAVGWLIAVLPDHGLLELLGAAILLSYGSLRDHVAAVASGLSTSLSEGRREVAKLVGRDVAGMEEADVARAALESAAESFSDGVVAPAFWFVVFGLPGILVYKVVNTADSMIGHRNERHGEFGMATARLDDALNWIPARLTGLLMAVSNGALGRFWAIRKDASLHRSPNAGWPEAALAAAMDVALSGPRTYDGITTDFPYINEGGRRGLTAGDVHDGLAVLRRSWIGLCVACILLAILF